MNITVAGLEDTEYNGTVIYRTTSQGHTNCNKATGPITSSNDTGNRVDEDSNVHPGPDDIAIYEDYSNTRYAKYRWGEIPKYNEVRTIM